MASEAQQVLLAAKYDSEKDEPKNYWMSEKMDGVRAYWSGAKFYSRAGNEFIAPKWFTDKLPPKPLDGELWCGRGLFQKCVGFVKTKKTTETTDANWKFITYLVFDAPSHGGPFEQRYEWLKNNIDATDPNVYAAVVGHELCKGKEHLLSELKKVLDMGGEGLMLREPKSKYQHGRNKTLLKVKVFHDEECLVLGSEKGSGRCADMMGKIHVELPNGIKFKIGTGFTDAQRKNPPKKGAVVTFKFQETSNSGSPRFPVFLRIREDVTWADVKTNAAKDKPFSEQKKLSVHLKQKHSILYTTVPSRDQESGAKQITDDDAIEPAVMEPGKTTEKPVCKYAELCFQTNEHHLAIFSHPEAKAEESKPTKMKTPCKFGSTCYRSNKSHLEKYSHDDEPIVDVVDEEEHSAEADVPKESLKRTATVSISVADVQQAAVAQKQDDEFVEISVSELRRLQEIAKAVKAANDVNEPTKKKSKN